jgi:hypothetical protein
MQTLPARAFNPPGAATQIENSPTLLLTARNAATFTFRL